MAHLPPALSLTHTHMHVYYFQVLASAVVKDGAAGGFGEEDEQKDEEGERQDVGRSGSGGGRLLPGVFLHDTTEGEALHFVI